MCLVTQPRPRYVKPSGNLRYHLERTLEADKTPIRFLMFLEVLGRETVKNSRGVSQFTNQAFEYHSTPPMGSATQLADGIQCTHPINQFGNLLKTIGMRNPQDNRAINFLYESHYCQMILSNLNHSTTSHVSSSTV